MKARLKKLNHSSKVKLLPKRNPTFQYQDHEVLVIPNHEGYQLVKFENILYCAADSNYVNIYTNEGKKITLSKTLKWVEARLNQLFIRTHQSYLINMLTVQSYNTKNASLRLESGVIIPVSRSMKKMVSSYFKC